MSQRRSGRDERDLSPQLLGVIARKDPELYQRLKEESENLGVKPIDRLVQIIKEYYIHRTIEAHKIDLLTFMDIGWIWMEIFKLVGNMFAQLYEYHFRTFLESYSRTAGAVMEKLRYVSEPRVEVGKALAELIREFAGQVRSGFLQGPFSAQVERGVEAGERKERREKQE